MNHCGTKQLNTFRLVLRRFCVKDAEEMFNNWANDNEVTKYLSWLPHGNLDATIELLQTWEKNYKSTQYYNWGICYDNNLIGSISINSPDNNTIEAEIGYCISKKFWGKGIVAEALSEIINFCFVVIGFKTVKAKHHIDNPNSGKVMVKAGMKYIETKICSPASNHNISGLYKLYEIKKADFFNTNKDSLSKSQFADVNDKNRHDLTTLVRR